MKTIKTAILAIMMIASFFFLLAECETFEQTLLTKVAFLADVILMTYLWQWWKMDKYYNNFINKE